MDLTELRGQLDVVDAELVRLFEKRMEICGEVAEYKKETGRKVYDQAREQEKIRKVRAQASNPFNEKCMEELFMQLMSMSRKMQYSKLAETRERRLPFIAVDALDTSAYVVYQGAEGSYSQAATEAYFGKTAKIMNVETFRDAMLALEEGSAAFAVLPIENSTAGIVSEIYDLLAEFEHFIVGEQMIRIEHCLLGVEGTTEESIRTVY